MSSRELFAASVRALRTARRLSQEKLGELSGLHCTYISSVERGECIISVDNMERIAAALGRELHELLRAAGARDETHAIAKARREPLNSPRAAYQIVDEVAATLKPR
jgi:transcriptional regulator with XRE-family HTH domain